MPVGRADRWRRDPRVGWSAAVGAAGTLCFVGAMIFLASPAAQPVDAAISSWLRSAGYPALTNVATALTALGGFVAIAVVTAATVIGLLYRRKVAGAVYMLFSVVPGWLVASFLKGVVSRPRPNGVALVELPVDFALPSGHTVAAALCYGALAVLVVVNSRRPWIRAATPVLVALVVVGVAWSRVYLGVHWFGDVVAALLFSAAWLGFCTVSYLGSVTEGQRRSDSAASRVDRRP